MAIIPSSPKVIPLKDRYSVFMERIQKTTIPTSQYVKNAFSPDAKFLGLGKYGEAWMLPNGAVLKLTGSVIEAECVQKLFKIQESRPEEYIEYFPKIYEYGAVSENVSFSYPKEHFIEGDLYTYFILPIFWYMRENIVDWEINENWDIDHIRIRASYLQGSIMQKFGVVPMDIHSGNWGVRPTNLNQLIFRDLACFPKGELMPRHQLGEEML